MDRRTALSVAMAATMGGLAGTALGRAWTRRTGGVRITAVSGWRIAAPRRKVVGRNAQRDVHGDAANDIIVRIETNAGVTGIGPGGDVVPQVRELVGLNPLDLFHPERGIVSPLGRRDIALWDLVGKLLGVPAWRLLGGQGPEWVPVYDSSFYFADLLPEHASRGVDRILEEIDASLEQGHRAFKLKVGRGHRWMEPRAGFRRDVEVVRAVRRQIGPELRLMVDANDGYDLATATRFLDEVDDALYFVEELFPEDVTEDRALQAHIADRGWNTLVADGESVGDPAGYAPYLDARVIDVLQPNILGWGLGALRDLAREAAPAGARLAPNNWDSELGLYAQLVLARGIPNFLIAEQDPGAGNVIDLSAFPLRDGHRQVPDLPGCGWEADLAHLEQRARPLWRHD